MGKNSSKIVCSDSRRLTGSLALDDALREDPDHKNASRWDYGIGYKPSKGNERVVWIEVHHASTGEVETVIRKIEWLRKQLKSKAFKALNLLTESSSDVSPAPFIWLATKGVHILKGSPQSRRLAVSGLDLPKATLRLP